MVSKARIYLVYGITFFCCWCGLYHFFFVNYNVYSQRTALRAVCSSYGLRLVLRAQRSVRLRRQEGTSPSAQCRENVTDTSLTLIFYFVYIILSIWNKLRYKNASVLLPASLCLISSALPIKYTSIRFPEY